ncbi:MAG: ABC transporter substrate-binding protein [Deferribacterales bacterium]
MLRILIALTIALTLFGCDTQEKKTNIGFLGTLSGRYSDLGQDTLKGAMLALEESGMEDSVNLMVKDDKGIPSEGLSAMNSFESADIRYIIGPSISNVATAVTPYLDGRYMFMLSPTVSTSELAGKDDHFMRTMPHNSRRQAENISRYLINKMNIKDMVIIYDSRNSSYAGDLVKNATETFISRGGHVRDIRAFNPESGESMNTLIMKDKNNPPQMYYILASAMDTALIIWQVRKAEFKSKILIRAWALSNEFFRFAGEAGDDVYLFDYYIDKTTKAYTRFRSAYMKKYRQEPSWFSMYGHESMVMMIHALPDLEKGASFYDAVSAAARRLQLIPEFSFDEYGDSYMPLNLFITKSGKTERIGLAE